MDTKDKKRRRPGERKPEAPAGRERPARRSREAQPEPAERPRRWQTPPERRAAPAGKISRSRAPAQPSRRDRVVRAPDRNVPEVTYSMPRPFSRGKFLLKIVSVVAVALAFMSCLSLFFKVDEVRVAGADQYTPYAIKEASGIAEGDSLLGISESRAAGRIIEQLPYIRDVKISRNLPGTVTIMVRELEVTYAIEALDGSWWLIASDGRVIEQIDRTAASGYTKVLGVKAEAPRTNQQVHASAQSTETVAAETEQTDATEAPEETEKPQDTQPGLVVPAQPQTTDADRLAAALTLLDLLEKNGVIGQMASIDVSSLTNITMEYGDRFHVVVGTNENLSYKIAAMTSAVEQLEKYEIGELDVSFKFSEKVIFNPEG